MSLERIYPIIALALLAGATLWLERTTRVPEARPEAELRRDPDFIGEKIRMISFDPAGIQQYELVAEKVTHYPHSEITDFDHPNLRYNTPDGELRVRARHGESRDGGTVIHLSGSVHVFREGIDGNPDLTLDSNTLTLWPDDQRAATDDPVVLTQGDTVANGNGLRADNLYGTLQLIGDAKVHMPSTARTTR